ncbi:hypothetical protein LZ31DRAFT_550554 [Colletotrichum somersetense]|nr:hypothetical protein LZ31DRAFT_550554 [Colletotrichum somersetense]
MTFTWRHPPRCAGPDHIGASPATPSPLPKAHPARSQLRLHPSPGPPTPARLHWWKRFSPPAGWERLLRSDLGRVWELPPLTMQDRVRLRSPRPLTLSGTMEDVSRGRFLTPPISKRLPPSGAGHVSQQWEAHRRRHDTNGNACLAWTSRFLSFTTKTATSSILDGNLASNTFARDLYACAPHTVLIGQLDRRCNIFIL